jgi:hypothetical protein
VDIKPLLVGQDPRRQLKKIFWPNPPEADKFLRYAKKIIRQSTVANKSSEYKTYAGLSGYVNGAYIFLACLDLDKKSPFLNGNELMFKEYRIWH